MIKEQDENPRVQADGVDYEQNAAGVGHIKNPESLNLLEKDHQLTLNVQHAHNSASHVANVSPKSACKFYPTFRDELLLIFDPT